LILGELLVRIKANADQFRTEITGLKKNFKDFSKSVKDHKQELRAFGVAATAVGVGLTGLSLKMGLTAARTEVLGTVLKVVGRNAGYSTKELKEQEDKIKKLGITTQNSRKAIIRFIQSNLDLADASKLARVAQDLAVISGQNSSDAYETLTNAIVAQRPILLKQFGIVTTLDKVYGKAAATLGKSAELLTENEKKTAFLNLILEKGTKVAGVYEEAMGDVGKQMGSFERYVEETANQFGKFYLPYMLKAILTARDFLKVLQAFPEPLKQFIALGTALTGGLALLAGAIALTAVASGQLKLAFGGLTFATRTLWAVIAAHPIVAVTGALAGLILVLTNYIDKAIEARNVELSSTQTTKGRIAIMEKQKKKLEEANEATKKHYRILLMKYRNDKEEFKKLEETRNKILDKRNDEIARRDKALLILKKDLAKEEIDIATNVTEAKEAESRKAMLARFDIEQIQLSNTIKTGENEIEAMRELYARQLEELESANGEKTKEYALLRGKFLDIDNQIKEDKTKAKDELLAISRGYTDAEKALYDKQNAALTEMVAKNEMTIEEANKIRAILGAKFVKTEGKISKDFAKNWNQAYGIVQSLAHESARQVVEEQVALGTAMENAAKESMKKYLKVKLDEAISSLAIEGLKQTGIASIGGVLSFGATLLLIPLIAAATTAAQAALAGIVGFEKGGITTAPTLAMTSEKGQKEAIIPLEKLPELMQRMEPTMTTMDKSTTSKSLQVTIIDNRLSGDPYDKAELARELGDILKEGGADI